jgi:hypothetical protein
MPPTVMSLLILGTHPPPILREGRGMADHQHQIRRIPDIVVHQIIAEMPEGRHQKGTLLEYINFGGFTLLQVFLYQSILTTFCAFRKQTVQKLIIFL